MTEFSTQVKTEIPANVMKFIEQWTKAAGDYHADMLKMDCLHYAERLCHSPIEQLFSAALVIVLNTNELEHKQLPIKDYLDFCSGISVYHQYEVGKYRVDFLLRYPEPFIMNTNVLKSKYGGKTKEVVVELDGHEFHDKNEQQRRYEKARDRYIQKQGYKVFRYTGAEIVRNPFAAALECVSYLTGYSIEDLTFGLKYGGYKA